MSGVMWMTKKELSQLYNLSKEIKAKEEQLEQLKAIAESTTAQLSDMPHGSGVSDKIGKTVAEIADIKSLIQLKIQEYWHEYNRLMRYINDIDDSLIRQIMTLRYINGMTWNAVADTIGGNTEDSIRMIHNRFLSNH
jgi:hypothetical protein